MVQLTREVKLKIYEELENHPEAFGTLDEPNELLDFLDDVWDLRAMPSEDHRFEDARGDIIQHTINNYDWDRDYLFLDRLNLISDDEHFVKFIETIVSPKYRDNEDDIIKFVLILNEHLKKDGYQLAISEYSEGSLPIYTLQAKNEVEKLPIDVKKNDILFQVEKNPSGPSHKFSSHSTPPTTPSFVLVFNEGWNDYNIKTSFDLFLYQDQQSKDYSEGPAGTHVGNIKIMSTNDETVISVIPNEFKSLDESFCSLGQDMEFYFKLKNLVGNDFKGVLYALRDAAFFSEIQEQFEGEETFNISLIRNDSAERLLREARHRIKDQDIENYYQFSYEFRPKFSEKNIKIDFNFDDDQDFPNRIYSFIGKNGTGKTQLITSLPVDIAQNNEDRFLPQIPLFSKVIAVSYSFFDDFKIPNKTASFNYVYCGLKKEDGKEYSKKGLVLRFHNSWKKIRKKQRIDQWRRILLNFIDEDLIKEFIIEKNEDLDFLNEGNSYEVSIDGFSNVRSMLSSGENIILYIITEIVANIRYDSLLLFDEPETHLHPNAITQLINTIYELVNEFQSYCIIATHSPLIIRELPSKSVYVMERHNNIPTVRKIGMESFGENLTTLTEEIFGNKTIPKQYKKIIQQLVSDGKSFDEIITTLKKDEDRSLSLNARIYIKSLLKE